ncbi:Imm42 family immunity protein [Moellerella wisconsensis]|uniref:Imm42 family immunity protein n=1 Tax=Moellerella wisconsensis TaxID=158849 RepID=UPI001F4D8F1D|nr:Imm42 family immunity protein [Moellerella wisconsensis]UNH24774.1 immunity 42 family protein [Moellerella wisconsensis]UNH27876.1 immunity 42 family protein [Moellerella wisconsensis]WJW82473.1 Imm42 family immunity protein [Moellerella wisconsensis]
MIIGDDFLKIAFQIEFIISDYSSPSGMFNFVINEKLIPGESVAIDLYVAISSLKDSICNELIESTPDIGNVDLDELDFSEGAPEGIIWLDTGVAEISGRGYWFYLGFNGDEERLIFTKDAGKNYQESRYVRGTIKRLIDNLPNSDELEIIKRNDIVLLTDLKNI